MRHLCIKRSKNQMWVMVITTQRGTRGPAHVHFQLWVFILIMSQSEMLASTLNYVECNWHFSLKLLQFKQTFHFLMCVQIEVKLKQRLWDVTYQGVHPNASIFRWWRMQLVDHLWINIFICNSWIHFSNSSLCKQINGCGLCLALWADIPVYGLVLNCLVLFRSFLALNSFL